MPFQFSSPLQPNFTVAESLNPLGAYVHVCMLVPAHQQCVPAALLRAPITALLLTPSEAKQGHCPHKTQTRTSLGAGLCARAQGCDNSVFLEENTGARERMSYELSSYMPQKLWERRKNADLIYGAHWQ